MRLMFHGVKLGGSSGGGCSRCGTKRKSAGGFRTTWSLILPSGRNITVRKDSIVEVSGQDAEFLLSYNGADTVFTRVDE